MVCGADYAEKLQTCPICQQGKWLDRSDHLADDIPEPLAGGRAADQEPKKK
jgi:hypothetical protein